MRIKEIIPDFAKLEYRLLQRRVNDLISGMESKFAITESSSSLPYSIDLRQPIRKTSSSLNKVENLKIASDKIGRVVIKSGEVFSFWKIVGVPSAKNGFKKGRNLIAGKLMEDTGGGLCQLSGIIYHLSLLAGMDIIERHHHSIDIYEEDERFTPLGADATVVFGYKDLRVQNPFSFDVKFRALVDSDKISCVLQSAQQIEKQEIVFARLHREKEDVVVTKNLLKQGERILSTSVYRSK